MFEKKFRSLPTLLVLVIIFRVISFIVATQAETIFSYQPSFPYYQNLADNYHLPTYIYSFANFDGVHYLTIAEKGYLGTGLIQAFFPVFPFLIFLLNLLVPNTVISGLIVSNIALLGFFAVWYTLLSKIFDVKTAWWSSLFVLFFPTSFFMGALYSESLFMMLIASCWWFAYKKQWWLAAVVAAVASATRVVGVLLVPSLWLLLLEAQLPQLNTITIKQTLFSPPWLKKVLVKNWQPLLISCLGFVGLGGYMLYLWVHFGDPIYFFHVQAEFGGGRQETLISWPQVVWRYLKIITTYRPFDLKYLIYWLELLSGTLGLLMVGLSMKKVPLGWSFFTLGAFLIPTLTGTFSSMPRYLLACLPIFVLWATWVKDRRWAQLSWLLFSFGWYALLMLLFVQGYWVA